MGELTDVFPSKVGWEWTDGLTGDLGLTVESMVCWETVGSLMVIG